MGVKRKRGAPPAPIRAMSSPLSPLPEDHATVSTASPTKTRRREAHMCGICGEKVPPRLLESHIKMELEGLNTLELPAERGLTDERGRRRAAVRARKSISTLAPIRRASTILASDPTNLQGTLTLVRKNRQERAARLREYGRSAGVIDAGPSAPLQRCPICEVDVPGEEDVVQAHVDACLAHVRLQQQGEDEEGDEYEWAGQTRVRVTAMNGFTGSGFHVLNRSQADLEDELDVDGDDEAVFGEAQFGENDILGDDPAPSIAESDSETVDDGEPSQPRSTRKTLRDLVAEGRVVRPKPARDDKESEEEVISVGDAEELDYAVATAKENGSKAAIIEALQMKVKQLESLRVSTPASSAFCRICLDPHDTPLVSIQCWHVHCKECWMRSLGVSKLCPQCKCITTVGSLRRVYL